MGKRPERREDKRLINYIIAFFILIMALLAFWYFGLKDITGKSISEEGTGYLTSCASLSNSGYGYILSNDVDSGGSDGCFHILGENVVIDCGGRKIIMSGNGQDSAGGGIYIKGENVSIKNCFIQGNTNTGYGVYLDGAKRALLTNNFVNNTKVGIYGKATNDSNFIFNHISNSREAVILFDSSRAIFKDGFILQNSEYGMSLNNSRELTIINNSFDCNRRSIYSYSSSQLDINSNSLSVSSCNGEFEGIILDYTNQSRVLSNLITGQARALSLRNSFNNELASNQLINNSLGFILDLVSGGNTFQSNSLHNYFDLNVSSVSLGGNNFNNNYLYSLSLQGQNKYGNNPELSRVSEESLSISVWTRKEHSSTGKEAILNLFGRGSFLIYQEGRNNYFVLINISNGTSNEFAHIPIGQFNDGNWHNLGVVYNKTNHSVQTYLDGILNSTFFFSAGNANYSLMKIDNSLFIGAEAKNRTYPVNNTLFGGLLDEIRIYNSSLNASEFNKIFTAGRIANSSFISQGLVAWYTFDKEQRGANNLGDFNTLSIRIYRNTLNEGEYLALSVVDVTVDDLTEGYSGYLLEGQELRVIYGNNNYYLLYVGMENNQALLFANPPGSEIKISLGESRKIDLNNDYVYDLILNFSELRNDSTIKIYVKLISEPFSIQMMPGESLYYAGDSGVGGARGESPVNLTSGQNSSDSIVRKNQITEFISIFILIIIILAIIIVGVLIGYEIYRSTNGSNLSKKFPSYDSHQKDSF
ncbi:MAG: right-handed parallel beta-helix repeat-containing protein [Nanoarchaeota archaeon]|nr:right-handed parallel beta-helix repeat-containing protein [Nanoarchaeota archaeon]